MTRMDLVFLLGVAGLIAIILLGGFRKVRVWQDWGSCWGNLRLTALGFHLWAEDHGGKFPMQVPTADGGTSHLFGPGDAYRHFFVLSNEVITPRAAWCPRDAGRTRPDRFDAAFANSNVSYFVAIDAQTGRAGQVLAGDRRLIVQGREVEAEIFLMPTESRVEWAKDIHQGRGNVAFVDGRVEPVLSAEIQEHFSGIGRAERLLIP